MEIPCGCGVKAAALVLGTSVFDVEVRILSPAPNMLEWCNGSHGRLKIYCSRERVGSNPTLSTNQILNIKEIITMTNTQKISSIDIRIALLQSRGADNGRIVKKLERQKRKLLANENK